MSHSRKSARRPSFVVIIASAAAAISTGCGASVNPDCADGGRCETPDLACPTSSPVQGSPCSIPATVTCDYGARSPCGYAPASARCNESTHTWQLSQSSCNPPPPMCPATAPVDGASCTPGWGASPTCQYSPCGPTFSVEATCDSSTARWRVMTSSCNPPPPVCPAAAPLTGDPCTLSQAPLHCRYGDCGDGSPSEQASCDSQSLTWRTFPLMCLPVTDGGGEPSDAGEPGDGGESTDGGGVEPVDAGSSDEDAGSR